MSLFIFITEEYSIISIHHLKKIRSPANKHLDSFQVLTIVNNADLTIHIVVFVWTQVIILLGNLGMAIW